jgi:hypothetical protein
VLRQATRRYLTHLADAQPQFMSETVVRDQAAYEAAIKKKKFKEAAARMPLDSPDILPAEAAAKDALFLAAAGQNMAEVRLSESPAGEWV